MTTTRDIFGSDTDSGVVSGSGGEGTLQNGSDDIERGRRESDGEGHGQSRDDREGTEGEVSDEEGEVSDEEGLRQRRDQYQQGKNLQDGAWRMDSKTQAKLLEERAHGPRLHIRHMAQLVQMPDDEILKIGMLFPSKVEMMKCEAEFNEKGGKLSTTRGVKHSTVDGRHMTTQNRNNFQRCVSAWVSSSFTLLGHACHCHPGLQSPNLSHLCELL